MAILDLLAPIMGGAFVSYLLYLALEQVVKKAQSYNQKLQTELAELEESRRRIFIKLEQEGADPTFFQKYGFSFDWVFVFKIKEESADDAFEKVDETAERKVLEEAVKDLHHKKNFQTYFSMKTILSRLTDAKLETKLFFSVQRDEIYCKIRAPPEVLATVADEIDYRVKLDEDKTRYALMKGRPPRWHGRSLVDVKNQCIYGPFDYIYGKFDKDSEEKQVLYKQHKLTRDKESPFRSVDRIKLILALLQLPTNNKKCPGCGFDLDKLVDWDCMLAYFPMHDLKAKIELEKEWLRIDTMPWEQPMERIKDYFGEKIAFYFGWLGHYTTWLIFAAVAGAITFLANVIENTTDSSLVPIFATFIAIWSTLFLETWKRKQSTYVMMWGMKGFEQQEITRPQFHGKETRSPIDDEPDVFFPAAESARRKTISTVFLSLLIVFTIFLVGVVFFIKILLNQEPWVSRLLLFNLIPLSTIIPSILNGVQITIMSITYDAVSLRLNDYENHRTDTGFEDSLIAKTFVFEFINKYAALLYIAFIKKHFVETDFCTGSCFVELGTTLGIIFLLALATDNTLEVATTFLKQRKRQKEESEGVAPDRLMSQVEKEYTAETFDKMLGTFKEYAEMTFQFGYATLFSAAFPLAPLFALVNNFIEIRIDGWKLLQCSRRPEPSGAEDIGTWYGILELIAVASVATNGLLIFFTGDGYENRSWSARFVLFAVFEHMLLMGKFATAALVPDVPRSTEIQLARQEFIEGKVIENRPDDEADIADDVEAEGGYEIDDGDPDPVFDT